VHGLDAVLADARILVARGLRDLGTQEGHDVVVGQALGRAEILLVLDRFRAANGRIQC